MIVFVEGWHRTHSSRVPDKRQQRASGKLGFYQKSAQPCLTQRKKREPSQTKGGA